MWWPSPVTAVAEAARAAIEEAVRTYTGYATTRVNVTVAADVPGERVTGLAVALTAPISATGMMAAAASRQFSSRRRKGSTTQGASMTGQVSEEMARRG